MVQLSELINENTDAFKDGYQTIPEIAKERIRRAGIHFMLVRDNGSIDFE